MTRPARLLRAVLAEPAVPDPPPPGARDVAIACVGGIGLLLEVLLRTDLLLPAGSVPLTLLACVLLVWRRSRPLTILVVVFASFTVLEVVARVVDAPGEAAYSSVIVLLLPYAVARWASGRDALIGLVLVMASSVLTVVSSGGPWEDAVGGFGILAATVAVAVAVRARATSRQRELAQVRSAERVDLARDLHDTVAHHVSAIAIRAEAGRSASAADPEAAQQALQDIQVEAGRALEEMRDMVRLLRSDAASYAPQPGTAQLERLATEGTPVLEVRRGPGLEGLPSAVDQAVFRIVQESVTNARRHASRAGVVRVDVSRLPGPGRDLLRLEVTDDGGPVESPGSTGHGLVGMEERAMLLGGQLSAGPVPGGGWAVRAEIPLAASGTADATPTPSEASR